MELSIFCLIIGFNDLKDFELEWLWLVQSYGFPGRLFEY